MAVIRKEIHHERHVPELIDGYKNSKWTVTITENGFIGEKDGNTNTYRDIVVKEI